jgi:hypothetical protein
MKNKKTELMEEFEKKTGKHAIYRGKITKQFKEWKREKESEDELFETINKEDDFDLFDRIKKEESESSISVTLEVKISLNPNPRTRETPLTKWNGSALDHLERSMQSGKSYDQYGDIGYEIGKGSIQREEGIPSSMVCLVTLRRSIGFEGWNRESFRESLDSVLEDHYKLINPEYKPFFNIKDFKILSGIPSFKEVKKTPNISYINLGEQGDKITLSSESFPSKTYLIKNADDKEEKIKTLQKTFSLSEKKARNLAFALEGGFRTTIECDFCDHSEHIYGITKKGFNGLPAEARECNQCDDYLRAIDDTNLDVDVDSALNLANEYLEGYGVEPITSEVGCWAGKFYGNILGLYVNMGDTYKKTILYDTRKGDFLITSMGEFVERNSSDLFIPEGRSSSRLNLLAHQDSLTKGEQRKIKRAINNTFDDIEESLNETLKKVLKDHNIDYSQEKLLYARDYYFDYGRGLFIKGEEKIPRKMEQKIDTYFIERGAIERASQHFNEYEQRGKGDIENIPYWMMENIEFDKNVSTERKGQIEAMNTLMDAVDLDEWDELDLKIAWDTNASSHFYSSIDKELPEGALPVMHYSEPRDEYEMQIDNLRSIWDSLTDREISFSTFKKYIENTFIIKEYKKHFLMSIPLKVMIVIYVEKDSFLEKIREYAKRNEVNLADYGEELLIIKKY